MLRVFWVPLLLLRRIARRLWVRISLYAALALAAAVLPRFARPLAPTGWGDALGQDAVMPILTILASSMLAVSTFSLNVMVAAHQSAAENATPRAHRLLLEDTTTQSALGSFIGAFIFALTTVILLQVGIIPRSAMALVLGLTVIVVVTVIVAMLRWIAHLSTLGSMDHSLSQVSEHAEMGLKALAESPALGGAPISGTTAVPVAAVPLPAPSSGYIQLVDVAALDRCLDGQDTIHLCVRPGSHVLEGEPLAYVAAQSAQGHMSALAASVVIGEERSYEQDPEFGLTVLSEIASKALSPGINDPGTAIAVIHRLTALLWRYGRSDALADPPEYPQIFVPVPRPEDLIDAAFSAAARDSAGTIEVAITLRRALLRLARPETGALARAAADMANHAKEMADARLPSDADRDRLTSVTA